MRRLPRVSSIDVDNTQVLLLVRSSSGILPSRIDNPPIKVWSKLLTSLVIRDWTPGLGAPGWGGVRTACSLQQSPRALPEHSPAGARLRSWGNGGQGRRRVEIPAGIQRAKAEN